MCLKSPKETEQGLKEWPVLITKHTTDSNRTLRNVSSVSSPDLRSHKTTAEPTSQQKTWHWGIWKMARRLQHITYIILFPASPEKYNTRKWTMDADCLIFMEAEIHKISGQKDYGIVNCWLLKHKKDLTKVSLSWPFRRNPRDMTGTQKPSIPCPSRYTEWS